MTFICQIEIDISAFSTSHFKVFHWNFVLKDAFVIVFYFNNNTKKLIKNVFKTQNFSDKIVISILILSYQISISSLLLLRKRKKYFLRCLKSPLLSQHKRSFWIKTAMKVSYDNKSLLRCYNNNVFATITDRDRNNLIQFVFISNDIKSKNEKFVKTWWPGYKTQ